MPYKDKSKQRESAQKHYSKNREVMIARARSHDAIKVPQGMALILGYLQTHPCIDCGEDDPIVLEFDHRPGEIKRFVIGSWRKSRHGLVSLNDEIKKCDVRCANCHRRVTYLRAKRSHRGIIKQVSGIAKSGD